MSNPFLDEDNVAEAPHPSATSHSKQPVPSPLPPPKKADKHKRRGGTPSDKGEGSKKSKQPDAASPHPVSSLFGEIAVSNFTVEDVQQ